MRLILISNLLILALALNAQPITKRVLFVGNSYSYVNEMPEIVEMLAETKGDELIWEKVTPGGASFQDHSWRNSKAREKILEGDWDYVALQEQSTNSAISDVQAELLFYPYAYQLDTMINNHNPCAQTMF